MTCWPAGLWLVESLSDGEPDDVHNMGVRDDIDVSLALAPGADQAAKLEFAQVLAYRRDALTRLVGQGAHIAVAAGEQPEDMQANRRRQQGERGGGVLQ